MGRRGSGICVFILRPTITKKLWERLVMKGLGWIYSWGRMAMQEPLSLGNSPSAPPPFPCTCGVSTPSLGGEWKLRLHFKTWVISFSETQTQRTALQESRLSPIAGLQPSVPSWWLHWRGAGPGRQELSLLLTFIFCLTSELETRNRFFINVYCYQVKVETKQSIQLDTNHPSGLDCPAGRNGL